MSNRKEFWRGVGAIVFFISIILMMVLVAYAATMVYCWETCLVVITGISAIVFAVAIILLRIIHDLIGEPSNYIPDMMLIIFLVEMAVISFLAVLSHAAGGVIVIIAYAALVCLAAWLRRS